MDGAFEVSTLLFLILMSSTFFCRILLFTCVCILTQQDSVYEGIVTVVQDRCEILVSQVSPSSVTMELPVTKVVMSTFCCRVSAFYHLAEPTWRRIQRPRLVTRNHEEGVNLFCGMLDGLTFLPLDDAPKGLRASVTILWP